MTAQASASSLIGAKARAQAFAESGALAIIHRFATVSTVLTCVWFAALTILG